MKRLRIVVAALALIGVRTMAAEGQAQAVGASAPSAASIRQSHLRWNDAVHRNNAVRWDAVVRLHNAMEWDDIARLERAMLWHNVATLNNAMHWNAVARLTNIAHWNQVWNMHMSRAPGSVNGWPCGGNLPPCFVLKRESGGNPRAQNPDSTASGLWQFVDGTWAGFDGYLHASHAPVAVQNARAVRVWAHGAGCSAWAVCPK